MANRIVSTYRYPTFFVAIIFLLSIPGNAAPYLYSDDTVVEAPMLYAHNPYLISMIDFPFPPDYFIYYFGSGGTNPFNPVTNLTGFYIRVKKYGNPVSNFRWVLYRYSYKSNPVYSDLTSLDSGSIPASNISDINNSAETGGISIPFSTVTNSLGYAYAISLNCILCNATNTYYIIGSDEAAYFYNFNNSAYYTSIDKVSGYTAPNETGVLKYDGFYLNNIFISIEGNYNYPILPPPTPTLPPSNQSYTNYTNYSYNYSEQGVWESYSNETTTGWNNSMTVISNSSNMSLQKMRNGTQKLNTSLFSYNYSISMPFLLIIVPAVIGALPIEFRSLITLSLIFTVFFTIMRRK